MGLGRHALRLPESPSSTQPDVAHQINASDCSEAKKPAGERKQVLDPARGDTEKIFFLVDQKAEKFLQAPDSYLWIRML